MDSDDRVLAFLLGADGGARAEELQALGIPYSGKGLLARMLRAFPGDPVAPSQNFPVGTTPTGLTPPGLAVSATVSVEGDGCRVRFDGTEVTTTIGLLFPAGSVFQIFGHDTLIATRFVGISGATVVDVSYWT